MTKAAVLGFLCTLAVPAAAMAESAPPAKIDAAAQTDFLGEIVITAQRRVEKLDQVPIAASVISGAELTTRGVSNLDDLGSVAPALNIQNQQALAYVNIRGVGLQSTNPTTSCESSESTGAPLCPGRILCANKNISVSTAPL